MKLPIGLESLLITVGCYALFFLVSFSSGGDESSNSGIALATFVAMTFFINFPLAWFFIYKVVKEIRSRPKQK